jgi:xanthine dehydrogenase accessory factor
VSVLVSGALHHTSGRSTSALAMNALKSTASRWLDEQIPLIVVEVADARGSVPREAGTRMLVGISQLAGTIGGGHLELKAIEQARRMLDVGDRTRRTVDYPLGPALGQCCGGAVTLSFARLDTDQLAGWPETEPLFHLQLYGAGHVGRAIVAALAPLPVVIEWIDEREAEFARFVTPITGAAELRSVCVDAVESEVKLAPPGAFYLVMTHEHDLDLRLTEAILRRGDFGYLGLIGSRTKCQRFHHRFEQRGIDSALIERITCPIGVAGIEGKQPEVIAVAVAAQLLQQLGPAGRSSQR